MLGLEAEQHSNLPVQSGRLIGREDHLASVLALIGRRDVRLLTLTGPGGSGKTRLALEVARHLDAFAEDGVWFVDLAPIEHAEFVPAAVARVLGVREAAAGALVRNLLEHLAAREIVLVLDNCERLLDAAPFIGQLLATCAGLKVLATSREPLRLRGEREQPVPPLQLPDLEHLPGAERLGQVPAVALFVERATAVKPDFSLTSDNAAAIAELCVRLDGLPLALELAAARVKVLTPRAMLGRPGQVFDVLAAGPRDAPERHRTLRDAIDWSYAHLSASEQRLFRRLAAFSSGWTIEAAEALQAALGDDPAAVLELLARLVDRSLINSIQAAGEPRFRMLETLREYASEQLEAADEVGATRSAHANYYAAVAERAEPELKGPNQAEFLTQLESEFSNFQAALTWATSAGGDREVAVRLGRALWRFWWYQGHIGQGRRWFDTLLIGNHHQPVWAYVGALIGAGVLARDQGDLVPAVRYFERALEVSREISDTPSAALALAGLAGVALQEGHFERCIELSWAARAEFERVGDRRGMANSMQNLSQALIAVGRFAEATELCTWSVQLLRELEDRISVAAALETLGDLAHRRGAFDEARGHYLESISIYEATADRHGTAECLEGLAAIAVTAGDAERAARLLGAGSRLRSSIGAPVPPSDVAVVEQALAAARRRLGPVAFEAAFGAGQAMSRAEAIAYASSDATQKKTGGLLTAREREVAALIARGLTNRQIADALVISERTAEGHAERIRGKLDVHSRAQVAIWAVANGLLAPADR